MTGDQLPPYTYVPGRTPHPISDPAGHSYGRPVERPLTFDPDNWHSNSAYLRGIELFNYGYYWEAHEEWESLWHAAGRRGPIADFLKGLIQLAVCGVKHYQEMPDGLRTHARRAVELLSKSPNPVMLGLPIPELLELSRQTVREGWVKPLPQLRIVASH